MRQGVARAILGHILVGGEGQRVQRISLETGPHAPFVPAQKLYASEGFVACGPFADYALDPYSLFMTKYAIGGLIAYSTCKPTRQHLGQMTPRISVA